MNDRTSSDNEDSPLSYMEDLITWDEERLDSDTKFVSTEGKKDKQKPRKKVYNMNAVDLFQYYISNLGSLSSISYLNLLEQYQIFPCLNPELYYTNCFLYALGQYGVSIDIIATLTSHMADIYIKTKDIGSLLS